MDSHSTPQPDRDQRPRRAAHQAQFQSASRGEQPSSNRPSSIWPSALPPASPVWFPSVMGTAILSSLLGRQVPDYGWLLYPATALMFLAIVLLIGLATGFAVNARRNPGLFAHTWRDMSILPTWGTVSMGMTATGSAIHNVAPLLPFGTAATHRAGLAESTPADWAIAVAAALWLVGTLIGLFTTFRVALRLMEKGATHPVPAWGLAVVPPMVSATTGAGLVDDIDSDQLRVVLVLAVTAFFFLALFFAILLFTLAYRSHFFYHPLPVDASISTWIPLGVVGQSTAASQSIAAQAELVMLPSATPAVTWLAHAYGWVALVIAIPVVAFAVIRTIYGFRERMNFTPGWWALTFPIGTVALGAAMMAETMSGPWQVIPRVVGTGSLIVLCCTWTFCAIATLTAIVKARATR